MIWSPLQLTFKQWIIIQQFTAKADLFLKQNNKLDERTKYVHSKTHNQKAMGFCGILWKPICKVTQKETDIYIIAEFSDILPSINPSSAWYIPVVHKFCFHLARQKFRNWVMLFYETCNVVSNLVCLICGFTSQTTTMVMRRSVNLTTLFLGRLPKWLTSNWQLPYLNQR